MTDRRTPRQRLGDFGEDHAAHVLARHGHTIIARGWRCAAGEIDLVTLDGEELVFVLEGSMEFEVDGQDYRLAEGDSVHFRTDRPHRWRNPGKRPARAVWMALRPL